jgi:hypothetical protein
LGLQTQSPVDWEKKCSKLLDALRGAGAVLAAGSDEGRFISAALNKTAHVTTFLHNKDPWFRQTI